MTIKTRFLGQNEAFRGVKTGISNIKSLLVILLCALPCLGQDKASRMEQVVESYVTAKQFMGSVLVSKDGATLLDKGYGFANLEWQIPDSPEVKFRLGSITKQFTAASILLLEERGKLSTDDLIKKYLPDAPAAWEKITIYHLLTHTSGLPNFTSFPDYPSTEGTPTTPEKLVARFRDKPLDFEPAEKWSYSNSGYVLLGYLLEKISGQKYSEFIQQNILTPLGMNESGYDSHAAVILHRASGYSPGPHGPLNAGYIDMTVPFSAGSLYSTTHDLLRWEQGLFGGRILSAASLKKMTTPFKNNYACGLIVETINGHKRIQHGGGIEGFNTHLLYIPDEKLAVIVLGNLNGGAPSQIALQLAAVVHGENVVLTSERKEVSVSPEILSRYVGTYALAPNFDIAVTLEGSQLMTQATNQPKVPVFAESETKFFLKMVDAQIEFVKNDKGDVTALVLHQGGREMKGVRK